MNWTETEKAIYEKALVNTQETNRALVRVYMTVQKEIESDLERFYKTVNPSWSKQYQAKRLEEIFKDINKRLSLLTGLSAEEIESAFLSQYRDIFYSYGYDLSGYYMAEAGLDAFPMLPFTIPDEKAVLAALNDRIAENSFMKSLEDQQESLRQSLRESVAVSIAKGESVVKLAQRLEEAFGPAISRIVTTARTEMLTAFSLAQQEAVDQALDMGIEFTYIWLGRADGRERDTHLALNNTYAKIDKQGNPVFRAGASKGPGPRLLIGPDGASQNINCRCRRLNVPFKVDTSQEFPAIGDRPNFQEYLKLI